MPKKPHKKEYNVSKEGRITDYPTLHETKEKGTLKPILKKIIHIHTENLIRYDKRDIEIFQEFSGAMDDSHLQHSNI